MMMKCYEHIAAFVATFKLNGHERTKFEHASCDGDDHKAFMHTPARRVLLLY